MLKLHLNRLNMLNIAVEDNPNFEISDTEIKRGGVSYTIDTIMNIKQEYNIKSNKLSYLIGSDSLLNFHNWKTQKNLR